MVITAGPCPEVCTQEIEWVCAVDEVGRRSDYRNACLAMSAGARVLHPGKCVAKRACAPDGLRVCALDAHTRTARLRTPIHHQRFFASLSQSVSPTHALSMLCFLPGAPTLHQISAHYPRQTQNNRHHYPVCCALRPIGHSSHSPARPTTDTAGEQQTESVQRTVWHHDTQATDLHQADHNKPHFPAHIMPPPLDRSPDHTRRRFPDFLAWCQPQIFRVQQPIHKRHRPATMGGLSIHR